MFINKKIKGLVKRSKTTAREMGFPLTDNDRRMAQFKNKHLGERCFLIGMGPSLTTADLDKLKDEVCFGCNKVYLAFEETEWRPTYYTVMDILVAENNAEEIKQVKQQQFMPINLRKKKILNDAENVIWYQHYSEMDYDAGKTVGFRPNILNGIYSGGYGVLLEQIQLAYYMGFAEAYVIGVDFSFKVSKSTGEQSAHGEVLKSEGEVNHFHKDYRKKGETWTIPRLELQEMAFKYAGEAFAKDGRKFVNASRVSKLDVLERADLDEVLASPAPRK